MKTIYENEIYDVVHISKLDENLCGFLTLRSTSLDKKIETVALGYAKGEYAKNPLMFIKTPLTDTQTISLIRCFSTWYGNTDQDEKNWAIEFQMIVRMLLNGFLVVNPKHLALEDVIDYILFVIKGGTENGTI